MRKSLVRGLVVLLVVMFLVAFSSPDEKANKLFVEAYQLINSAKEAEETSYPDALKLYKDALIKLESIVLDYPSTRLAVEIIQDKAKIGDYNVTEFKTRIVPLAELRAEAEGDLLACAFLLATTISDIEERGEALAMIAGRCAEVRQYDKALRIVQEIRREPEKSQAFAKIAFGYATAGQYDTALQVVSKVKSHFSVDGDMEKLAIKYAEVGRYDLALQVVERIADSYDRGNMLIKIIDKYAESGQEEGKTEVLSQILHVVKRISGQERFDALLKVADEYKALGQGQKALNALSQACIWAGIDMKEYPSEVRLKLLQVAAKYEEFRRYDQAIKIFEKTETPSGVIIQHIKSERYGTAFQILEAEALDHNWFIPSHTPEFMPEIAIEYAKAGQYDQALRLAELIDNVPLKAEMLAGIAVVYGEAGQESKRSELLSQALQEAEGSAHALAKVAMKYAEVGQHDKVFQIATTIANFIDADLTSVDSRNSHNLLRVISLQYADVEQYDLALQIANLMQDDYKARLLIWIIERYDIWDHEEIALEILTQVSTESSRWPDIAIGYAKVGQYSKALQLAENKVPALIGIIAACGENGQYDKALQVAKTIDDGPQDLREVLFKIALQCIDAGQYDIAFQIANIDRIDYHKYDVFAGLIANYLDAGQYDRAFQLAKEMRYESRRVSPDIAKRYAEAGQYDKVLHVVEMEENESNKVRVLIAAANGYVNSAQTDRASNALFRASQEIKAIESIESRIYILAEAGVACTRGGLRVNSEARKVLHEIVKYSGRR
jgi:tetratricopeptide (TPR) repeat protein